MNQTEIDSQSPHVGFYLLLKASLEQESKMIEVETKISEGIEEVMGDHTHISQLSPKEVLRLFDLRAKLDEADVIRQQYKEEMLATADQLIEEADQKRRVLRYKFEEDIAELKIREVMPMYYSLIKQIDIHKHQSIRLVKLNVLTFKLRFVDGFEIKTLNQKFRRIDGILNRIHEKITTLASEAERVLIEYSKQ